MAGPPLPPGAPPAPPAPPAPQATRQDIEDLIRHYAAKHNVDPDLALSIAEVESNFNPKAISKKGARGVMQMTPATAKTYGVQNPDDLWDPAINIDASMQYLRALDLETQHTPTTMARRYVASPRLPPEKSDFYVRRVFDAYRRRMGLPMDTTNQDTDGRVPLPPEPEGEVDPLRGSDPAEPRPPAGLRPTGAPTWNQQHPILNSLAQSLDPHERQGRQNIAGGLGSAIGGGIGGVIGTAVGGLGGTVTAPGPGTAAGVTAGGIWGRRIGSAIGAGAGGALENLAVEETPLGGLISKYLPWGTQDEPSTPAPNSTVASRTAGAAGTQAASDVIGQGIMGAARFVGKRIVQQPIARAALETLEDNRKQAAEAFAAAKLEATHQLREAQRTASEAYASLAETLAQRREQLRQSLLTTTIRPARAAKQSVEDATADEIVRHAAAGDARIASAQAEAQRLLTGAQTTREQALAAAKAGVTQHLLASAPHEANAGGAIADIFENAAQAPKERLGQAVDAAAAAGPDRDMGPIKAEAQRLATKEVLPPSGLTGVNPLADVLDKIVNAPDTVPFAVLHQWKKELSDAVKETYTSAVRGRVKAMTKSLAGTIRRSLSGYEPYDAATAAYEDVIPRYTTDLAKTIRRTARSSPEAIVDAIDMRKPTQAGFLVKLMTEAASEGGDAKGGRMALEGVQDAWFYRHVLDGSLETLGDRLTDLKKHPEFVRAFLDDPRMAGLIKRAEELAKSYPELVAHHDALVAGAKSAGEAGVTRATTAKETAVALARKEAQQKVRGAAANVTKAIDEANTKKAAARGAGVAEKVRLKGTHATKIEEARRAKETVPTEDLDRIVAELTHLNRSTLGGRQRGAIESAADALALTKNPLSAFGGLRLSRLIKGASDADIARYIIYAKQPTRAVGRALVTSTFRREAPAIASQPIKAGVADSINRTLSSRDQDRSTAPPRPPR